MALRTLDFDYELPDGLIAQQPSRPRDASRLMLLDRAAGRRGHHVFADLPRLLREGDLLVVNDTRVVPAKFECRRRTGGRIEGLFLREHSPGRWEVMLKGADRCRAGEDLTFAGGEATGMRLEASLGEGLWHVSINPPCPAQDLLERVGLTPLPPYIRRAGPTDDDQDRRAYQTIYAGEPGAVAAPTAGLHFTESVLSGLRDMGVGIATVTLHVGLGTFAPVKADRLEDHRMHAEWYRIAPAAAGAISSAKGDGRRVVAVGTTSVRVLETAAYAPAGEGWTDLFIYPPATFQTVDALITNFHLPRSTLLMLVAAFCSPGSTDGIRAILDAYAEAVRLRYRFYSYGDAMLIQ